MTMNSKNSHIVIHIINIFSGIQPIEWELDVVYMIK